MRIGYSVGGLIPFPLIVAKENRFFEQAGLDVELINIPPTIAVTALISGDIQYVIFAGTTLNAAVRGLPVKLVMVYNDRPLFSLMSRAGYSLDQGAQRQSVGSRDPDIGRIVFVAPACSKMPASMPTKR